MNRLMCLVVCVLAFHYAQASSYQPTCMRNQYTFSEPCPAISYVFPNDQQTSDYVRYRSYVPSMTKTTLCAWIHPFNHLTGDSTIFSYSRSSSSHNEYVVIFQNGQLVLFYGHRRIQDFGFPETLSKEIHFCFTIDNDSGFVQYYRNGILVNSIQSNHLGRVAGGGTILLGQEQDQGNGGGLDRNQAYQGRITGLMMWPRVLSGSEINGIVYDCMCPRDYSIAFLLDRVEIEGNTLYSVSDNCPTPF